MLHGKKYANIAQASGETKHSRATINRMLRDPTNQRGLKFDHSQPALMEELLQKQRLQAQKLQLGITTGSGNKKDGQAKKAKKASHAKKSAQVKNKKDGQLKKDSQIKTKKSYQNKKDDLSKKGAN